MYRFTKQYSSHSTGAKFWIDPAYNLFQTQEGFSEEHHDDKGCSPTVSLTNNQFKVNWIAFYFFILKWKGCVKPVSAKSSPESGKEVILQFLPGVLGCQFLFSNSWDCAMSASDTDWPDMGCRCVWGGTLQRSGSCQAIGTGGSRKRIYASRRVWTELERAAGMVWD